MSHSILMPLINSPFALGEAQACAESFIDADERAIAMAELAYFQGRPEDAAALSRPYLEAPDVALRSSACFVFAYASLPKLAMPSTCWNVKLKPRAKETDLLPFLLATPHSRCSISTCLAPWPRTTRPLDR